LVQVQKIFAGTIARTTSPNFANWRKILFKEGGKKTFVSFLYLTNPASLGAV
jgi:hypothetical protein